MNVQVGFWILVSGAVLAILGSLWLTIRAFKTSPGWGLAVLFLPVIGAIAFLLTHPSKAKPPFAMFLLGGIVAFSPIVINQFADRRPEVPLERKGQIVTRGALDPKYDDMLGKTDTEIIGFNDASFTDDHAQRLDSFAALKRLDLSDSGITDQSLRVLAKLPKLEVLILSRVNGITDEGVKELLAESKSIREIQCQRTAVTRETLKAWKANGEGRKTIP